MSVTTSLERIKRWTTQHDPQFVALLQPGLSRQEIDAQVSVLPFALAEEVYELYQWHNGQSWGDFKLGLQQSFLYPFIPLQDALKEYTEFQAENFQFEVEELGSCEFAASGGWLPLLGMEAYFTATLGAAAGEAHSPIVGVTRDDTAYLAYSTLSAMLDYYADVYDSGALRSDVENKYFFDYTTVSAVKRRHFPEKVERAEEAYREKFNLAGVQRSTRPDRPTESEFEHLSLVRDLIHSGSEQAIPATEIFLSWPLGSDEEARQITHHLVRFPTQIKDNLPRERSMLVGCLSFRV